LFEEDQYMADVKVDDDVEEYIQPSCVVLEDAKRDVPGILVDDSGEEYQLADVLTFKGKWYVYDRYIRGSGRHVYRECMVMQVDEGDLKKGVA
jgi:hypothetical protein